MKFVFAQALAGFRRRKALHIIMLLSFVLGLASLFIGLTYGEASYQNWQTMQIQQPGMYTELYVDVSKNQGKSFYRSEIDEFLAQYPFATDYTCVTNVQVIGLTEEKGVFFAMVDHSFDEYFNVGLLEGSLFTDVDFTDEPNVCVVEGAERGLHPGDTVQIGGHSFSVIGVISSSLYRSRTLVPQNSWYGEDTIGFDVVMAGDAAQLNQIDWSGLDVSLNRNQTTQAYTASVSSYVATLFIQIFVVCFIFFIYMLFNTYNILKNKAVEDARAFGIRMAVGATAKDVFRQFFIEVLIMMLLAVCVIVALDPLVAPLLRMVFEHRMGPITIGTLFASCIIAAYVLARIVLHKIRKLPVVSLIGGRAL